MPDFNLLQAQAPANNTQVVQIPNYQEQDLQGFLGGMQAARENQQIAMQQQLLPGQLQQQKLTNQGLSILNQENTLKLQQDQYDANLKNLEHKALQEGGVPAYEKFIQNNEPDKWTTYQQAKALTQQTMLQNEKSLLDLTDTKLKQGIANVTTMANGAFNIMKATGNDPAKALDLYKQEYPTLAKTGLPYPDPTNMTPKQFEGFAMGTMAQAMDINSQMTNNPYTAHIAYGSEGQGAAGKDITGKINMTMMPQIAVKNAEVNQQANAARATNQINAAQTAADVDLKKQVALDAYDRELSNIENEAKQSGNSTYLTLGEGSAGAAAGRKALEAMGVDTKGLKDQVVLDQLSSSLKSTTMMNLQKGRVTPEMAKAIEASTVNKTNPVAAQHQMIQNLRYSYKVDQAYAEYLKDYADAHNQDMAGANTGWSNFLNSDPNLKNGLEPDPKYLSRKNYKQWIENPDFQQEVAPTTQQWTPASGMNPAAYLLKQRSK